MIDLPTSMPILLRDVVDEALSNVLPPFMNTPQARVGVCAIAGQESGLRYRIQQGSPIAHSLWQFEPTGINGVLSYHSTAVYAQQVCAAAGIPATVDAVYAQMLVDDVLGCRFARLLLWTSPNALPDMNDPDGWWNLYYSIWRPGKPDKSRWLPWFNQAVSAVDSPIVGTDFKAVVPSVAAMPASVDLTLESK